MTDDRKYVRVYYSDLIRDYPDVWSDDALLATWLRMLATADPMWPTPPELPRSVRNRPLARLVDSSLVTVQGDRFRMKGLDAERSKRSDAARNAAAKRWHSEGIPPAGADAMPTKPDQTNPDQSNPDQPTDARDPADIYWQLTGKYPGEKTLPWIDQLTSTYGADTVIRHLVGAHMADSAASTLLGRTQDLLRAEARQLDKRERAAEEAALKAKRAVPRKLEPWQEEFRRRVQEQYDTLGAA